MTTVIFTLTISLLTVVLNKRKNHEFMPAKTYYFVYTNKRQNDFDSSLTEQIKLLGGAGVDLFYNNEHFLIVNCYLEKSDAENVVQNLIKNFSSADVLEINFSTPNGKIVEKIKQDEKISAFFKFYQNVCDELNDFCLEFLIGKKSVGEVSTFVLNQKLKIEEILNNFNPKDAFSEEIFKIMGQCKVYFENFLLQFFNLNRRESLLCELTLELIVLRFDMNNIFANY